MLQLLSLRELDWHVCPFKGWDGKAGGEGGAAALRMTTVIVNARGTEESWELDVEERDGCRGTSR